MKDAYKYLLFILCCLAVFVVLFFFLKTADDEDLEPPINTAPVEETGEAVVPPASTNTSVLSPEPKTQTQQGSFEDRVYNGEGTVRIITENGVRKVVLSDDFATESGPDLFVYISDTSPIQTSQDAHTGNTADLGRLQRITGPQEYLVPDDVTFAINSVTVYCVAYKVVYTSATIH